MMAFGIVAGIIGSFVGSIIAGKGYLSPRIFSIGLISGGIMSGVLAGEYNNLGISSMLGLIGGFIAGLFSTSVRSKINRNNIIDSQGVLGPVVVVCLVAAYIVAPCMLHQFYIRSGMHIITKGMPEDDWRVARYQLIYPSLTIAFAIITGLLVGFASKAGNFRFTDYRDYKFFAHGFGLYDPPTLYRQEQYTVEYKRSMTQSQLNRETHL